MRRRSVARVVHRLGFLFPPEITGLVVLRVAAGIVPLGASKFLGINYPGEPIRGFVEISRRPFFQRRIRERRAQFAGIADGIDALRH